VESVDLLQIGLANKKVVDHVSQSEHIQNCFIGRGGGEMLLLMAASSKDLYSVMPGRRFEYF
jgi:hypothetical protein